MNLSSNTRGSRARKTALLGILYQGTYAVTQLISLGLIARYVERDLYGLWMTILACTTWVPAASLGQNAVVLTQVGAVAHSDKEGAARSFTASLYLVLGTSVLLLAVLLLGSGWLPWKTLLNADTPAAAQVATATAVAAIGIALATLPLVVGGFAVFAHQRGDIVHVVMGVGSLVSLAAVGAAISWQQPLWIVGGLAVAGPLIGGALLWMRHFGSDLLPPPRWDLVDAQALRKVACAGLHFLLIDALTFAIVRTPEVIVAQLHGVEAVGPFASVGRLPLLLLAAYQAVLLPFWPSLSESARQADGVWIRRVAGRTLALVLTMWAVSAALLPTLGPTLIALWLGSQDFASFNLLIAACAQSLGLAMLAWTSVLLSALSRERVVLTALLAAAVAYLPAAVVSGTAFGPVGVAAAQATALLLVATPIALPTLLRVLAEHRRKEASDFV